MMRVLAFVALAAGTIAASAPAAAQVDSNSTAAPSGIMDWRLRTEIAVIRALFGSIHAPPADSISVGAREIAAGTVHQGTVAIARGNLSIRGRVTGHAIALHGDVIVYPGGLVAGNAIAVDGRVRTMGGVVEGDVRSIRGITGGLLAKAAGSGASTGPVSTWGALKLVVAWFAILFAIGIGVLLFAETRLDGVMASLDQQFARSFWVGLLAQVAAIPMLLVIVLALAISLIGILLIPFAIVAYVVTLAGLLTMGFIAISRFTGRAFFRAGGSSRAIALRALFVGLLIYLGLWLLAAAFVWSPVAGSVLRAVALAGSWVALTFGLGATMLTRAGTRRSGERAAPRQVDDLSWQTPTPVAGVVAARRPVATIKES